jgi:hypothetical protein
MTDSEALNKATDAAIAGVERLAAAVEKVAPDAWDVMVRQQVLEGWSTIGAFAVIWLFVGLVLRWAHREIWSQAEESITDSERDFALGSFLGAMLVVLLVVAFTVGLCDDAICQILNPEYYAAADFLQRVK